MKSHQSRASCQCLLHRLLLARLNFVGMPALTFLILKPAAADGGFRPSACRTDFVRRRCVGWQRAVHLPSGSPPSSVISPCVRSNEDGSPRLSDDAARVSAGFPG